MPTSALRQPLFIQLHREDHAAVRQELAAGLQAAAATLSPKYLYDPLGSRLFDAITELPEYYPTRTEAALLAEHGGSIAQQLPRGATLVDLGAGNCEKAARLFGLREPARYVAVDISVDYLHNALQCMQRQFPALEMMGVGLDFSTTLDLPPQVGGGLLIGVDLVKPREILEPAYDDTLGVTAAFNKNLLLHVNRLLGADFHVPDWQHVAFFNAAESRIEMHLQAQRALTVRWPGAERCFGAGERIHTENSYKYRSADFEALLREAGFARTQAWTDARGWFAVYWAQG